MQGQASKRRVDRHHADTDCEDTMPVNMPNFLPRRSEMGANSGLVVPSRERAVINRDMVEISTPSPRAKTGRKGYTILWAVFRMVRRNMKMMSW
jgi:hypothetical protein